MNCNLSERTRVIVSGLKAGTITSLLMFAVVEALSPHNLMRKDPSETLTAATAPFAMEPRRDA